MFTKRPLNFCALSGSIGRRNTSACGSTGTVTEIALQCGFNHFGRFAAWYREQYGESPLATLKRSQSVAARSTS